MSSSKPIQPPMPTIGRSPSFMRRSAAAGVADPDTLVGLACDENYWVRRQAVKNPATPSWILDLLVRAGATPDLRGKGDVDPTMDAADLHRLVECGPWAQQLVSEHPNTPGYVLDVLKLQPSLSLRLAIARHPNSEPATLATLCADGEATVRSAAANHPQRPSDIQQLLEAAGALPNLQRATRPPKPLSADQLQQLYELGAWGRFLAARHPNCPVGILEEVARDSDWRIRSGALDNPNTPIELLVHLLATEDDEELTLVHQLSALDPPTGLLEKLVDHPNAEVRLAVARHPATSTAVLSRLLSDGTNEVRSSVANNPRTDSADIARLVQAGATADLLGLSEPDPQMTASELDQLSRQGSWARLLAVRHPNTAPETLGRLVCDADPKIREWAAVHPNTPADVIENLIRAGSGTDYQGLGPPDPTLSTETLRELSTLGPWAQSVVAANPHVPITLLEELAESSDEQVGKLAAANLNRQRPTDA